MTVATDPAAQALHRLRHWHAEGYSAEEIAEWVQVAPSSVYRWLLGPVASRADRTALGLSTPRLKNALRVLEVEE